MLLWLWYVVCLLCVFCYLSLSLCVDRCSLLVVIVGCLRSVVIDWCLLFYVVFVLLFVVCCVCILFACFVMFVVRCSLVVG